MKNALGKEEDLKLYNKNGDLVYKFYKDFDGFWYERTYDDKGNELTVKLSTGYWCERTYDDKGNQLTFKDSNGDWSESTYDDRGNVLTYKSSDGDWSESTYDDKGKELTYKNSKGESRGFNIPEYTMEQLTQMIGNFKIKK